jgi:hypothetical protein
VGLRADDAIVCAIEALRPEWSRTVVSRQPLSTDPSGCYGILLESIPIWLRSGIFGALRTCTCPRVARNRTLQIARVLPSPLGLVRDGNKCKTQKERVGEAKNNDHNLLLRPRGRVF